MRYENCFETLSAEFQWREEFQWRAEYDALGRRWGSENLTEHRSQRKERDVRGLGDEDQQRGAGPVYIISLGASQWCGGEVSDLVVPPPHTNSDCPIKPFVSQRGSRTRDRKEEEARAANPPTDAPSNAPTRSDSVSLRNRGVDSNGDRGRSAFVVKLEWLAEKRRPGGRLRVTARVNLHQIKPLYASPWSASQELESYLI